eukprot:1076582-Prymnesium_polylepis.1
MTRPRTGRASASNSTSGDELGAIGDAHADAPAVGLPWEAGLDQHADEGPNPTQLYEARDCKNVESCTIYWHNEPTRYART